MTLSRCERLNALGILFLVFLERGVDFVPTPASLFGLGVGRSQFQQLVHFGIELLGDLKEREGLAVVLMVHSRLFLTVWQAVRDWPHG